MSPYQKQSIHRSWIFKVTWALKSTSRSTIDNVAYRHKNIRWVECQDMTNRNVFCRGCQRRCRHNFRWQRVLHVRASNRKYRAAGNHWAGQRTVTGSGLAASCWRTLDTLLHPTPTVKLSFACLSAAAVRRRRLPVSNHRMMNTGIDAVRCFETNYE